MRGFVGRLTFSTTDAFSKTDLLVTNYAVKSVNLAQIEVETVIVGRMSTGEIRRVAAGGSSSSGGGAAANAEGADFDGDRTVDLATSSSLPMHLGNRPKKREQPLTWTVAVRLTSVTSLFSQTRLVRHSVSESP